MKRRRADLAHLSSYSQEYKTAWMRKKRGSVSWAEHLARVRPVVPGAAEGCDRPKRAKGYCSMHYWRLMRHGDPFKLVRDPYTYKRDVVGKMSTKEYYSDMTPEQQAATREIMRSLVPRKRKSLIVIPRELGR